MLEPGAYDSLGELLHDALLQWKSRVALLEVDRKQETKRLSYLEVRRESAKVATWLERCGVGPGERVSIIMSNQARWLIAALGVFARGAILVPIDFKLSADEQLALLQHSRARALITEYPLFRRFTDPPDLDVLVSEAREPIRDAMVWEQLDDASMPPIVARQRRDAAAIVYSSGTGGRPKGCVLSNDAYLEQLASLMKLYPMSPEHRTFSVLPTNHAIDFMVGFVGPFACGSSVVHQRTLRPEFLISTMQDYSVTHLTLVPALLAAFERAIDARLDERPAWQRGAVSLLAAINLELTRDRPSMNLSRRLLGSVHEAFGGKLELLVCGGAFTERRRAERFYELGIPVVIGYGLTECATVATLNDLKPFRADSVGRPVPGVEIRIHEPNGEGIGEVWIRGRTLLTEYWGEPELTEKALTPDGWLRTGDLGWLDASSHLHLVGRSKNMIVTAGGKNVYPEDVESAFEDLPCEELVIFSSSFVWRSALTEEILLAVVRPKNARALATLTAEIASRNRRLPEHKRLGAVLSWDREFPRTASMKVKREALADELRVHTRASDVIRIEGRSVASA